MTPLREVIPIPERVTASDFVLRLAEGVQHTEETLRDYVVTPSLAGNFDEALGLVGQAVRSGRSQAAFLHGSFGSGKSHFMAVLHALLTHNPTARGIPELADVVAKADDWLQRSSVLQLTYHLIGAESLEAAVLGGYAEQVRRLHPDATLPAVHRSDALLDDAQRQRELLGDEQFFEVLGAGSASSASPGWGAFAARWDAASYEVAATAAPDDPNRQRLVNDLVRTLFSGYTQSADYVDLDTGLAVLSRHAAELGYDAVVLYLDELILWLASHLADHEFVAGEGAKLAKLVESADARRAAPLVSFVARQRDLTEFLGAHVPGAQRQAFADVFGWSRGRFEEIRLEDRNLPVIAERRLLQPKPGMKAVLDEAFERVDRRPDVWDVLLLGAQNDDAGVGSDPEVFRRIYPFSPALVATLVALSQALQRERTALKVMLTLLVNQRDELEVEDLIPVGDLFDVLVAGTELPDEPQLKRYFEIARNLYRTKLLPALLAEHGLDEHAAAGLTREHELRTDDRLVKTLLLSALVPEVPALRDLTAGKLAALNHGTIATPLPGQEKTIVLDKVRRLAATTPEIRVGEGADPQITVELAEVDYEGILDRARSVDTPGERKRLMRELVWSSLGARVDESLLAEQPHPVVWRGRKHIVDLVFGNVRDAAELPDTAFQPNSDHWKVVVDFPFDEDGYSRRSDIARVEALRDAGIRERTVCWLPAFFTRERLEDLGTLVVINHVLAGGGERFHTYASSEFSPQDRGQAKTLLEQRQRMLRERLTDCVKQAYGTAKPQEQDIGTSESVDTVFFTLESGFAPANPVGATLGDAFRNLAEQMLDWTYPGKPNLPVAEAEVRAAELRRVLGYVERAVADPARRVTVEQRDRPGLQRICNPLGLGELVENVYVLGATTFYWTRHFLQQAAKRGYDDHFPVRELRAITDEPEPRGLDRAVQNLLIAAFALDHDLAWHLHGSSVSPPGIDGVSDDMELRQPRLPSPESWSTAVNRASALLGVVVPDLRSAGTLAKLTGQVQEASRAYGSEARELARLLERHADVLGIDATAAEGRLATARATADLLERLARETDDVALVDELVGYALPCTDQAAGRSVKSARALVEALSRTEWHLLKSIRSISDERAEEARTILDQLADTARRDEFEAGLEARLDAALREASSLLARPSATPEATKPAEFSHPSPQPADDQTPTSRTDEMLVRNRDDLDRTVSRIADALADHPGKNVRVTWQVTE